MPNSESTLLIDFDNLKHNIEWFKSKTESKFICPMVKANSYGGGAILISKALSFLGIQYMGVARVSEAEELRSNGIESNILLFNHFTEDELALLFELQITLVVSSEEQLRLLIDYTKKNNLSAQVHLEFDTGMSRLGFTVDQIPQIQTLLQTTSLIHIEGVFTHFLDPLNWPTPDMTSCLQHKTFEKVAAAFPDAIPHIASSKSLTHEPGKMKYGLRPGLWLHGIEGEAVGLRPTLRLVAPIISLRKIAAGQSVSYGGRWTASRPSVIATIPVGYGDGYSRRLSGQSHVIVKGHRVPTVGVICMDFMMIDVTEIQDEVALRDEVTLIGQDPSGQNISIESLAEKCDVIAYEFVVRLSRRVKRKVVGGPSGIFKSSDSAAKN